MRKLITLFLSCVLFLSVLSGCGFKTQPVVFDNNTVVAITHYSKIVEKPTVNECFDIDFVPESILNDTYISKLEQHFKKVYTSDLIILNQLSKTNTKKYMAGLSEYTLLANCNKTIKNHPIEKKICLLPMTGCYHRHLYNKTIHPWKSNFL